MKFEGDWDRDWAGDDSDSNGDSFRWEDASESGCSGHQADLARDRRKRTRKRGFMVSGSSDCSVCVWDLDLGPVVEHDADMDGYPDQMHIDDDGERQVTAEVRAVLRGHSGGVLDLRIDKQWIVSWCVASVAIALLPLIIRLPYSSKDTAIRVWNRNTLGLHRILRGHEGPVNAIGLQSGRVVRNRFYSKKHGTESHLSSIWLGQRQWGWENDIMGYCEREAYQDVSGSRSWPSLYRFQGNFFFQHRSKELATPHISCFRTTSLYLVPTTVKLRFGMQ